MKGSKFLSRKFVLALLACLSATGLLAYGLIEALNWVTVTMGVVGLYMAGNVAAGKTKPEQ